MKQGSKILLFSSIVLGSVVAGTVSVSADSNSAEVTSTRPTATQIIEKQDQASAEDLAVAKEIFSTANQTTPSTPRTARDINTEIIEKQDTQTDADRAVAKEIFSQADKKADDVVKPAPVAKVETSQPFSAESDKKAEEVASVTVSLDQSVANIHYDRPQSEEKTTILHYVWSDKDGVNSSKWLQAGKTDTKLDLTELGGYGVYNINSYKEVSGNLMLFNKASVNYKKPAAMQSEQTKPHVEVISHVDGATLTVQLKRGQDLGKALVQYAVWSEENGQDDVQWYVASQTTKIDLSKHKGYGKYHLHTYAWLNGQAVALASNDFIYLKKETPKPVSTKADAKPTATTGLAAQGTYHFTERASIKNEAKVSSPEVSYFDKGMSVYYDKVLENDGHKWLGYVSYTGMRHYVDLGALEKKEVVKPATTTKPEKEVAQPSLLSRGTYHFTSRVPIKDEAKVASPAITYFDKGMSVYYDKALVADGRQWISYVSYSGDRRYVDLGAVTKAEATKPAAQPVANKPEKKEAVKQISLPSSGIYTFTGRASIKAEAKVSAQELAYYDKGMSVNYDKTLVSDNHQWLSYISFAGNRRYVDLGAVAKTEVAKPAAQPVSTKPEKKEEVKAPSLPASGTYTFTGHASIKAEPKVSAPELAYYDKGMSVYYDKTLTADGKNWISYISHAGNRRYIAVGAASQASTPAPAKPVPVAKNEPTNLVAARLAFAQHGSTSNFDVEVTDMTGKGTVRFAVWNGQNGQDDLKWYDMKRVGDKFVGSFDMNQHRGNGPLYIHAYYQEAPGAKMQFVRGLQF